MINLLINKRTRLPIAAKPLGSPWTARELDGPNLCVVTLDDPPAELAALSYEGCVVANPFAECETDPEQLTIGPSGAIRMVRQSTIELPVRDVRPGASVRIEDCRLQIAD